MTTTTDQRRLERKAATARKRIEDAAITKMDEVLSKKFNGRAASIAKIRAAKRPSSEAKRQIQAHLINGIQTEGTTALDYSDVQELRVQIIRRDGILDTPHASVCSKMDKLIAEGAMTEAEFARMSGIVKSMPCAITKHLRG
jgi:hypothetical protein